MKRVLPLIITLLGFVLIFAACQRHANDVAENTCPYALMHDDVLYYYTGEAIYEKIKITEDALLGRVTSVIPETSMPTLDGQANIDILDAPYMHYTPVEDGIIVLIDGEWVIFERRDGERSDSDKEKVGQESAEAVDTIPEIPGEEGFDSYTVGTAEGFDGWICGATYGGKENPYMRYWIVDAESNGTTVTKLIPSEQDGEFYYSFGLRKYKTKSSELCDFKTFRVVFENGRLLEVEETESLTKKVVLEKGVPFSGSLDGDYFCETLSGTDYGVSTIVHSLNIVGDKIKLYSYLKGTDAGGEYDGKYIYNEKDGTVTADLTFTVRSNGEIDVYSIKVEGKLLEYGGFVHFVLTSAVPETFGLSVEDVFPMTFRTE